MFNRNDDLEFRIIKDIENARLAAFSYGCKAFAFTPIAGNNGPTKVQTNAITYDIFYIHKSSKWIKYCQKYLKLFYGQIAFENGKEFIIFPTRLEYASLIR